MFEITIHRRFLTIAIAIMVLGFASTSTTGHQLAHANGDGQDVAIMQQSGAAGHQLVAFDKFNGKTSAQFVITCRPATGHDTNFASTMGNGVGRQMITWRNDNSTTGNLMAALVRTETWQMASNSGGFGHRLSAKRTQGGHQVIAMAPRPAGLHLRT